MSVETIPEHARKLDCRTCASAFALVDTRSGRASTFCRCNACPNREQMEQILAAKRSATKGETP